MKRVLLLVLTAFVLQAVPTVSNATAQNVSWSSAEIQFTSTSYTAYRLRYVASPGSCSGGSGGHLQINGTQQYMLFGQRAYLTGLIPSTAYKACPETTSDGVNWSSGVEVPFTTSARGTGVPIAPTEMSRTFPAITGATQTVASNCSDLQTKIDAAETVRAMTGLSQRVQTPAGTICQDEYTTPTASDAHNFANTDVTPSTARLAWASHGLSEMAEIHFSGASVNLDCLPGTTIHPRGINIQMTCGVSGGWNLNKHFYAHVIDVNTIQVVDVNGNPEYPGWITFTSADVDFSGDTITLTPNEFTPNGFATDAGSAIAANTEIYVIPISGATMPGGISATTPYFIKVGGCGTAATCALQISATSGGAAVNISDAGSGTFMIATRGSASNSWVAPAPTQTSAWIWIETAGTLPAEGTRITSASDAQLFHLQRPADDRTSVSFTPGILAHNIGFRGAIFDADTAADTDYMTMMEPRGFRIGPTTYQSHRYIVFDRCRFQGATTPHRTGDPAGNGLSMELNGGNIAIINSDMRDFDFPKSWRGNATTGVGVGGGLDGSRVSNSVVRLTAGVAHLINGTNITVGSNLDLTISNGGGVTGVGRVGVDLAGHIQYLLPAGVVATCNTAVFANCDVSNDAGTSPAFPTSSSRRTWLALGTITFTAGNVPVGGFTAEEQIPGYAVSGGSEGTQAIIAGKGPGPFLYYNNHLEASGLMLHFDEGGGQLSDRGDYVLRNNTLKYSTRARFFQAGGDGLFYGSRQPLEWKAGNRVLVTGNTFEGCFSQIHSQTFCIIITGYYYSVTDFDISYNTFYDVNGGVWYMSSDRLYPASRVARRLRIANNSFRINAWNNYAVGSVFPRGFVFQTNAMEDLTIEHNTVFNNRGDTSNFIRHNLGPVGGAVIRDNIGFFNGEAAFIAEETASTECVGLLNKAFLDCEYVQGAPDAGGVDANYTWTHNIEVPSWTSTSAQTGQVAAATVTTALSGLTSGCGGACVPNQMDVDTAITSLSLGCVDRTTCEATSLADLVVSSSSPYFNQGTSGSNIGIEAASATTVLNRLITGQVIFRGGVH